MTNSSITTTGDLTLNKIKTLAETIATRNGNVDIAVCDPTSYAKVRQLLEQYIHVSQGDIKNEEVDFSAKAFCYGGIKFLLERNAPSGTVGLLDSSSWAYYHDTVNFANAFMLAPHLVASYILPWSLFVQFLCIRPGYNGVLANITS